MTLAQLLWMAVALVAFWIALLIIALVFFPA
jgi:hypothetical protein